MVTWKEYFECAGLLFAFYAVARVVIWLQFRNDFKLRPPSNPSDIQNQPIDTSGLARRLEDVRRDYAAETQNRPSPLKKSELVAERRTEIAKSDFFKPPPASEPPEHEQWVALLMV